MITLEPTYLTADNEIPIDLPPGSFVSLNRQPPLKIYGVGFQPAKSIPEIARWFLNKYATIAPFVVLEPFAGSGTTLIESLKWGVDVYWLDYQPLSRLICQVKTSQFNFVQALQEAKKLTQKAYEEQEIPNNVDFANKDFWFQKPVQEALEILRLAIIESNVENQPLFWLGFAATVRKTSNMNDGMILAAKRSNIAQTIEYSRQDVFKYFQFYTEKITQACVQWSPFLAGPNKAKELPSHDARQLDGNWQCDAVITSPPYINAIDYVWAAKFELHWLGLVESDQARLDLYAHEIGTERIAKADTKLLGVSGNQELDQLIEDIFTGKTYKATKGQNELRARVTYKYFVDMQTHFKASFAHLKEGGYYCFAIGDISKICGVDVPVAKLLTELACEVGFTKNFDFHLLLKNRRLNMPRNVEWAGTIKHDSIVVLEKPTLYV